MFAPCVCSLYECRILCAARVETSISLFFFRILRRPHVPHTSIRYGYQVFLASSNSQQVPRSFCCTKRLSPLKLSHGHHVSTRAASARAEAARVETWWPWLNFNGDSLFVQQNDRGTCCELLLAKNTWYPYLILVCGTCGLRRMRKKKSEILVSTRAAHKILHSYKEQTHGANTVHFLT